MRRIIDPDLCCRITFVNKNWLTDDVCVMDSKSNLCLGLKGLG